MKKQVELSCMVCGVSFIDNEPQMCCSGRDCGCMGMPSEPIVCSDECYNQVLNKDSEYNQKRRIQQGTTIIIKAILIFLLPLFVQSQDTLPAILKVQQGNYNKYVKGYVVLTKDCVPVEYLRVNTWRKKEKLLPFSKRVTVVDYRLIAPELTKLF